MPGRPSHRTLLLLCVRGERRWIVYKSDYSRSCLLLLLPYFFVAARANLRTGSSLPTLSVEHFFEHKRSLFFPVLLYRLTLLRSRASLNCPGSYPIVCAACSPTDISLRDVRALSTTTVRRFHDLPSPPTLGRGSSTGCALHKTDKTIFATLLQLAT